MSFDPNPLGRPRFEKRVVVITGGGAGIGRRFAHRFAEEGASVVVADRDSAAADRVAGELENALAFAMDVTDEVAAQRMVNASVDRFGAVDILVNNAGLHLDHAQLPYTIDAVPAWRQLMDVNVIGALVCSVACRQAMASRGGGSIINMSSMAAYSVGGAYGVSKLALNALTVGLAAEFGNDGIRVNGIAPGLVDSEAAVQWWNDPARSGMNIQQRLIDGQIIKRQGRMDDLADAALFLCSEKAGFITGQTLLVDGGHTRKPF